MAAIAADWRLLYISARLGLQLSRSFGCACQGARCSSALLFISLRACVPPGIAHHAASPLAPRCTAAPEPIAQHLAQDSHQTLALVRNSKGQPRPNSAQVPIQSVSCQAAYQNRSALSHTIVTDSRRQPSLITDQNFCNERHAELLFNMFVILLDALLDLPFQGAPVQTQSTQVREWLVPRLFPYA